MTTPVLAPVFYEAGPVNPAGYGLFAAATIIETGSGDDSRRHIQGVKVRPFNCDQGFGTYDSDACVAGSPAVKEAERALDSDTFEPVVVWAADECATDTTEAEAQARADQTLRLHAPLLVESVFGARLLADAGAPQVVASLEEAIGVLEEFMGEQGYTGYIHAARRWAAPASQYRWTNQTGAILRSPMGHGWVFGGGYASVLGNTLVATGPLYLWRDTPFRGSVTTGTSPVPLHNNSVYALAEQVIVPAYECAIKAVTITPPTP
jgi:hypothetical protein